jgi:serine/threonine protein kinase
MERFDQYLLLKQVGAGGMAQLFKAKKTGIEGFERIVAIKRILPHLASDEEFIEMFVAEAKLAARLSHKNIVQIYDFGKSGQDYFIAMEYVPGKDLRTISRRCHAKNITFPPALAIYIGKEVAGALNYAHNQKDNNGKNLNIIHRDISPQNILLSYDGEVKVVDFGIAKAETNAKTSTGVLKGKVSYMSPEQAWGKGIDHRSDLFSLGIVLYEILTGERLFKGETEIQTLEKVREAKVQPLPSSFNADISPNTEAKILKALAREPDRRYQSGHEMEMGLGEALFEIAHFDPSSQLRQFMHDLFKTEIEEEQFVDIDQTVYVEDDQDNAAPSRASRKSVRKTGKSIVGGEGQEQQGQKKRLIYIASVAVLLLAIVASGVIYFQTRPRALPVETGRSGQIAHQQPQIPSQPPPQLQPPQLPPQPQPPQQVLPPKTPESPPVPKIETKPVVPVLPPQPLPEVKSPPQAVPNSPRGGTGEVASRGTLSVNAKPWATVYVGGTKYGRTPQVIRDLDMGAHTVRLENPDFGSWETNVKMSMTGPTNVYHEFGGFGKLMINAKPWANVYLDGAEKGQTPLTLDKVPSGEHKIRIVREGFDEITKTIVVKPTKQESLSVSLKKKDN